MPFEYSIDTQTGMRIHICTGNVTADGILQALGDVYSRENFSHAQHALWDFRNCTSDISSDEMENIIIYVRKFRKGPGGGKVALVVSKDADFGLARMYGLLSEYQVDRKLMVFRDYDQALKWLKETDDEDE
jgi:hypothetical protein